MSNHNPTSENTSNYTPPKAYIPDEYYASFLESQFKDKKFKNFDFKSIELTGRSFYKTEISSCSLKHVKFPKSPISFEHSILENVNLETVEGSLDFSKESKLTKVFFTTSTLKEGSNFSNAHLKEVKFRAATLIKTPFTGANLYNVNFNDAEILGSSFNDSLIRTAFFKKATLLGCDYSKISTFNNVIFDGSEIGPFENEKTTFEGSRLNSVSFKDTTLTNVDFSNASFVDVDFTDARFIAPTKPSNIKISSLYDDDDDDLLQGILSKFDNYSINKPQTVGCNFKNTTFKSGCTTLKDADLSGAINLHLSHGLDDILTLEDEIKMIKEKRWPVGFSLAHYIKLKKLKTDKKKETSSNQVSRKDSGIRETFNISLRDQIIERVIFLLS